MTQLILPTAVWIESKDGNADARAVFDRHYSRRRYPDGTTPALMLGPGEKMVLVTPCLRAVFAWRRYKSDDDQTGINCAIFRNEGAGLSSALILAAERHAISRWGGQRAFTYVDPRKVRSPNPGYCFLAAGWRRVGFTKKRKYLILAKDLER